MARFSASHVPVYRHHKPSGQARVRIAGKDHYLGVYNSPESHEKYNQLIAQWFATGRTPAAFQAQQQRATTTTGPTITQVIAAFWAHAQTYYRDRNHNSTGEAENFRIALRLLRRLHGSMPAAGFDTTHLEACQAEMIREGLARTTINNRIIRIRHVFKWGVSKKLVPATVHAALQTVPALKAGRSNARETKGVTPAKPELIEGAIAAAGRHVAAMIGLQLVTGMRPGEMVIMRTGDIDRSGNVWTYRPAKHKTQHHGHTRVVYLGVKAQELVTPFLKLDGTAYIFSPAEAEAERRAALAAKRRTPLSCGNRGGTNRKASPKKAPGERYTTRSYSQAVAKACRKAFPVPARITDPRQRKAWIKDHHFHPHQLRHNAGTRARAEGGIELTAALLGQTTIAAAEVYGEMNMAKAREFAARAG